MKRLLFILLVLCSFTACGKQEEPAVADPVEVPLPMFELRLFGPGDYGSDSWRIPAILSLEDGSLVMTCDKRKYNDADLPQDIDIVARRSTDRGQTWTEPVTIAQGTGLKQGFGDAALVQCGNGDVVCVFVGGNGLFASSEEDPIRSYVCRSTDGGLTWSAPVEITAQLWGSQATNNDCKNYRASFFGSGNGLRLTRGEHAGRIMFAAAMCRKANNTLDNFIVYSDDNGQSWQVSGRAYSGGDEAKLMELTDGRVLISVRRSGARGYNTSDDGGESWGTQHVWQDLQANACNGDMLRVAATDRGDSCNIILHSLPNSMNREDVSLFVSRDEGQTWQHSLTLVDGPSVYSSLTLLRDGSVGALVEKTTTGSFEIWYQYIPIETAVGQQ